MSEYIEVGQPLQFTDPNTPTRAGEVVENVSDIYDIPSPRLGMQVFVKSEKKSYVITSLKSKTIGGVNVPEAAVETFEPVGAKSITWNNDTDPSNMNDFVDAGVYDIKGERTRANDNLPILNTGGGHSFNARLTVLDSSITGSGKNDDKCITQVLSFSNRLGQGEMYIRTGKGSSLNNLTWEKWSTLQRNVNVGQVTSLDPFIDNGIYSGVFIENGVPSTFVMIVINDYFVGASPRRVSQFLYKLSKTGEVSYTTRIGVGDGTITWNGWEVINKKELDATATELLKRIQGTSANSSSSNDPFKRYPTNFSSVANTEFMEALNTMHSTDSTSGVEGFWRLYIGRLAVEVKNVAIKYVDDTWVQTIKLPYKWYKSSGVFGLDSDGNYHIHTYYRIHKDGAWGEWMEVEEELKSAITAEVTRAKAEETAIRKLITDLIGESPETLDSIHEISSWILNDKTGAAAMAAQINKNKLDIENLGINANAIAEELSRETSNRVGSDNDIKNKAALFGTFNAKPNTNSIEVTYNNLNQDSEGKIDIPAATTEQAGVMSAKDKKKLNNLAVEGANVDLNTYYSDGVYVFNHKKLTNVPILNDSVVSARLTVLTAYDGTSPVITQALNLNNLSGGEGNIYIRSNQNGTWKPWGKLQTDVEVEQIIKEEENRAIEAEEKLEEKIAKEKTALINGDTIVGQAREIHSRNGKTVTDSFLVRTTAGSGTIGDGVASVKQIGGNIVKNLVDGRFVGAISYRSTFSIYNNIGMIRSNKVDASTGTPLYGDLSYAYDPIEGHVYYHCVCLYNVDAKDVRISINGGKEYAQSKKTGEWVFLSYHGVPSIYTVKDIKIRLQNNSNIDADSQYGGNTCFVKNWLAIDLTEMFGAGNEPDKATCDKLFDTMDALPQGLSIANPTEFKSIGFNQFNPENVLEGKAIVDNAIVSGDKKIAVIPCLPCKVGVGENNGYCIHGDFGDDIKVYLTPLNPREVDGELYMHELTKDATTDTYVPLIKGYMLVEVPTTDNLCAHFLWSEDKCERDSYEPYFESKIELPVIPQMSEWGLAGMNVSEKPLYDIVDVANNLYVKRIKRIDLGSITWNKTEKIWHRFVNGDVSVYAPYTLLSKGYLYSQPIYLSQYRVSTTAVYDAENNTFTYNGVVYSFAEAITQTYARTYSIAVGTKLSGDNFCANIICANYPTMTHGQMAYGTTYKCIGCSGLNPAIYDPAFSEMTNEEIQQSLSGVMAYYEISNNAYEEYPITVIDNNYISSDYGVEQFDSKVPCNANNLYYMRSLAGEARNFLDRLMAGLGTQDATVVADRILAVVNPVVEPVIEEVEP